MKQLTTRVGLFAVILGLMVLTGCAAQTPTTYSWSHAASGEYLFAFDLQECEAAYAPASADFISCMESRGYFQVDPQTREPIAASIARVAVPSQGLPQASR